jgi:raffinose/stachyose/melibiose transport system substrate-binding protein
MLDNGPMLDRRCVAVSRWKQRVGGSRSARIAAIAAGVVLVIATSVASAATPPNQQRGSFSMVMNLAFKPGFDILIANFNRVYPNIKVTPTYYSVGGTSPYATVVATQLAAGSAPDVVWTVGGRGGPTYTQILAEAKYLDPLDGRKWTKRLLPATKPDYQTKGKLYASELGISVLSLIMYNKDYFRQNNLQVPRTFSQLLSLCRTIASQGKIPISWGGQTPAVNANNVVTLAGNNVFSGDPRWYAKRLNKQVTFAGSPGWRRSVQQALDLKNAGCFRRGFEGVSFANMANEFASGQAVMMWTVPILLGDVSRLNPNINFGMFPPPGVTAAQTRVTVQPQGGLALLSKAAPENKRAALAFIDFVAREKQARLFSRINFLISSFDALKGNLPTSYADLTPFFKAENKVLSTITSKYPNTQFSNSFGASVQGLFTGQKTVDDVLQDMDKFFALT